MAPMGVVSWRTSKIAGEPPHTTGAPGAASCESTTPDSVSAACWTTLPTRVTGATKPASGIETSSTGTPARAQSITFWLVSTLHLRGAVGQQEKTHSGFSRSASAVPRTASCSSRITSNPPAPKAPVTTGFSPRRSERNSR